VVEEEDRENGEGVESGEDDEEMERRREYTVVVRDRRWRREAERTILKVVERNNLGFYERD
jgi:hypothetical protein